MESSQSEQPLLPELHEAEISLEHALTEACATTPATRADTGELIKIEEMLSAASDAAKRAISLRRRRRADRAQRTERWAMGDAEAAAALGATHRSLTDARGVWWDVFAVFPEVRGASQTPLKGTFAEGWLCFDSGTEKRRLSPIPPDWRTVSESELDAMCARAEVASARKRRRKELGAEDRPESE